MRPDSEPEAYLWDMRETAREVLAFVEGVNFDDFLENRMLQLAVERDLEIIGEAATHVPQDYRVTHDGIPWRSIIAERNILIHAYPDIRLEEVWNVVHSSVPLLLASLEEILPEEPTV